MSLITRSWLSFAAIGAGIIHLALVISSPLPAGIVLALLGLGEITWGIAILVRDRLLLPRIAQVGAIAPLVLWSLLVVVATLLNSPGIASPLRFLPMGIAAMFELFVAGVLSAYLRRQADSAQSADEAPALPAKPASAARDLAAVLIGGVLVGALTTPALAATQAGAVALEHGGTMGGMMTDMGHH